MNNGRSIQCLYDYIKNGDGHILYNITSQWRECLGGQGENSEYKNQYMKIVTTLGGTHLKERLKKEASIDCKQAEVQIAKTTELTPGYFLRIQITPELSEENEKKARPVLDKICEQALVLLGDFRRKLIDDAMKNSMRPSR